MTRPLEGSTISAVIVSDGGQHHRHNLFGRVIGMKGSPRVGCAHQAVILHRRQQNEFAFATTSDVDRPPESGLNDFAGPIAEIGEGKMCHPTSPRTGILYHIAAFHRSLGLGASNSLGGDALSEIKITIVRLTGQSVLQATAECLIL
jgi:hypothetical protein